jgi:hypothetical protein
VEGIELRPRRAGEVLDAAVRLARRGFWRVAPTVVVGSVPPALVALFVVLSASGEETTGATELGAIIVLAVLLPFSVLLLSGASVVDLYHLSLGAPITRRAALRRTVRRVPALFVHLIVVGFALGIAQTAVGIATLVPLGLVIRLASGNAVISVILTIVVVVAIYVAQFAVIGRVALGVPALVIDRDGPLRALGRSIRLTAGQTWSIALVLFTASLLSFALSLVVTIPILVLASVLLPDAATGIGAVVGYVAIGLAAYTFFSALLVILFVDGRVRAEGLDLQLTAAELGFPATAPWPNGMPVWVPAAPSGATPTGYVP